MNNSNDAIKNDENYLKWRKIHTSAFGNIFEDAFEKNSDAQVMLTSALIKITEKKLDSAFEMLNLLEKLCDTDWDRAAVSYFSGLCCEISLNPEGAESFYDQLLNSSVSFDFPSAFQPYYRTAKLFQQASECTRAIDYYKKALRFYENASPTNNNRRQASQIIYDIATVCLYSHKYSVAQSYLDLSREYCSDINWHREYVQAILYALEGKTEKCERLVCSMPSFLKQNCRNITEAIYSRSEPHYFAVEQSREDYGKFWTELFRIKKKLADFIISEKVKDAEDAVSALLTEHLPFARRIECKIEVCNGITFVKCKDYFIKTLGCEYERLFSQQQDAFADFRFVCVNEFGE